MQQTPKHIESFEPCPDCKAVSSLEDRGSSVRSDFSHAVKSLLKSAEISTDGSYGQVYVHAKSVAEELEIPELYPDIAACVIKRGLGECSLVQAVATELI